MTSQRVCVTESVDVTKTHAAVLLAAAKLSERVFGGEGGGRLERRRGRRREVRV
jgi:hypothetical protein